MRVIAGTHKGRRLQAPTWSGLRPTSDRLRETLFDILAPRVVGARVLDVYAGTGAIGIEALSRGAASAVFVEQDRRARALIARNLAHCGIAEGCAIIQSSAERALDELRARGAAFDLILLDPPYADSDTQITTVLTPSAALLAPDGLVVLEHARRRQLPTRIGPLAQTRLVAAGDSALAFYAWQP
ncbi:MAG: 16S rRNA (guanine(966)-N(2))-methyltransferase RsmD [Acidobacteria bacterium]|nr:16S rRNA (guanine(966)-N(2))-methyltransferase RsmD [Acidobacteriota bacterium]